MEMTEIINLCLLLPFPGLKSWNWLSSLLSILLKRPAVCKATMTRHWGRTATEIEEMVCVHVRVRVCMFVCVLVRVHTKTRDNPPTSHSSYPTPPTGHSATKGNATM